MLTQAGHCRCGQYSVAVGEAAAPGQAARGEVEGHEDPPQEASLPASDPAESSCSDHGPGA